MFASEVDRALLSAPARLGRALATIPEGQYFERKSGRVSPKDLAIALVAMANAEGGTIVVGIHAGLVDGVAPERVNALRQAAFDHTRPAVRVAVEERIAQEEERASTILVMRVEPSGSLHTLTNDTTYLRVGDESRKLTAAQRLELSYDRGAAAFEGSATQLTISHLDADQMGSYAGVLGLADHRSMLLARDLLDRRGRVTVAACLLFDHRPQRDYPHAVVRVLRYGDAAAGVGSGMTLEDGADVRFEGSIPQQIQRAAEHIERLMPKWQQLGADGLFQATPRIPRDAWLEALVNAVVHRSYSQTGDHVRVEIYPNRLEVTSPGRFPGIVNPNRPLEIDRYARNPRIARVCSDLGITRELGEGIRRMFDEMRRRGLADPMYRQTQASVHLTLLASDALPAEVLELLTPSAKIILDVMRLASQRLGTGQLAELAGISRMTATRALGQLRDLDLVRRLGQSPNDPRATWELR